MSLAILKKYAKVNGFFCLFVFVALRPKTTDIVLAGSLASLNKRITNTSCTYFYL